MKNKNNMNLIKANYMKVPNAIFSLNLDVTSIGIYLLFLSMPESFNPSPKFVCDRLGISRRTFYRKLNQLLDTRLIELVSEGYSFAGNSQVALYRFNNPSLWVPLVVRSKKVRSDKGLTKNVTATDSSTDESNESSETNN